MGKLLQLALAWVAPEIVRGLFRYIFGGAIGLVTYAVIEVLFWRYINQGLAQLTGLGGLDYLINLSRLDDALSVVIGAMASRASIIAMTVKIVSTDGV